MTPCDRVRTDAAGLAAQPAGDAERDAAWVHARECPACARSLDEAERLQALVGDLASSPPRTATLAPASLAIISELRREARSRMLASVIVVCTAFALFVALARRRSPSGQDWAIALALAASATALGAAARRWGAVVVVMAPLAALAVALGTGAVGPLHLSAGVDCLATALACAAAVVAGAWLTLRRGTSSLAPSAVAAGAAAGALGGVAALQLTCSAHTALPHLVVFHVGGVLLATAAVTTARSLIARAPRE